ncbi:MAG: hypothetical protein AAF702_48695 [Chloroflexota bacterium]
MPTDDSIKHRFPVRCPKCDHVTWFEKRAVCQNDGVFKRTLVPRGSIMMDRLRLPCENPVCDAEMVHEVDCRGYK